MDTLAAGGYSVPSTVTFGWQVHQSSSLTPDMAEGMCEPQPRHVFLAVECVCVSLGLMQTKNTKEMETYSRCHR